jgi:hypothetical protein
MKYLQWGIMFALLIMLFYVAIKTLIVGAYTTFFGCVVLILVVSFWNSIKKLSIAGFSLEKFKTQMTLMIKNVVNNLNR